MQDHLTLRSPADLEAFLADPGRFRDIRVALPELDPSESARVGIRLSRLASECGCTSGGIGALITLAVAMPVLGWLWYVGELRLGVASAVLLGLTSLAALLAKFVTLALARHRLRRHVERLREASYSSPV